MRSVRTYDIIVVGAGPAGIMAAIVASRAGASVLLLEQMPQTGLKLLATGGGRCNLTNRLEVLAFLERFGSQRTFIRPALHAFGPRALVKFFEENDIPTISPDGFHIFPQSESAVQVRDALVRIMNRQGITVRSSEKARHLWIEQGVLRGIDSESGKKTAASRVILATGGRSYSQLGSSGSGYPLARQARHTIVEPIPALVPLVTAESWPCDCAGLTISQAKIWIDLPGNRQHSATGSVLFTHRGISGPAVLDLSREISLLLTQCESVPIRFAAATPPRNEKEWIAEFDQWQRVGGSKSVQAEVCQYLPGRVAGFVCDALGIADHASGRSVQMAQLNRATRSNLAHYLSGIPLSIKGTEGFAKAMVTRGGVSTAEVRPKTLESRLLPGLYFAGEILDIDGPCGGYNLQWAFSSGTLAGLSAAQGGSAKSASDRYQP